MNPPKHSLKCYGILIHNKKFHIMFVFTNMKTSLWLWRYCCHRYILIIRTYTLKRTQFNCSELISLSILSTHILILQSFITTEYSKTNTVFISIFHNPQYLYILFIAFFSFFILIFFSHHFFYKWKIHQKSNDFPE